MKLFYALIISTVLGQNLLGFSCAELKSLKGHFKAPNPHSFEAARKEFLSSIAKLRSSLPGIDDEHVEKTDWIEYLKVDSTEALIHSASTDTSALDAARRRFFSNRAGLEHPVFEEARTALLKYVRESFAQKHAKLENYNAQIGRAISACSDYFANPSIETKSHFSREYNWFARAGQSSSVLSQLEKKLSKPNAEVRVAEWILKAQLTDELKQIKNKTEVNQCMTTNAGLLGAPISSHVTGQAQLDGTLSLDVVPNNSMPQINLNLSGTTTASSFSNQRGVTLHSTSTGTAWASAPVLITRNNGISVGNVQANVQIRSNQPHWASSARPLRARFAMRRASRYWVQEEVRRAGSRTATSTLKKSFKEQIQSQIANVNPEALNEFQGPIANLMKPMIRYGAEPWYHSGMSTDSEIRARFMSSQYQLGANSKCPSEANEGEDIAVCIHQSFITNMNELTMSRDHLFDRQFKDLSKLLYDFVPFDLEVHQRTTPWSIHLSEYIPFTAEFIDGKKVRLSFNLDKFTMDEQVVEGPFKVSALYDVLIDDLEQIYFQRIGMTEVAGIASQEQVDFLSKKMNALFGQTVDFGGIGIPETSGALELLQEAKVTKFETSNGWLIVKAKFQDRSKLEGALQRLTQQQNE